jgi:hypothetical protein
MDTLKARVSGPIAFIGNLFNLDSASSTDWCVYGKWDHWDPNNITPHSTITVILVHSDDLTIASNLQSTMESTNKTLLEAFDGVDQGDLTSFCGVEIDRQSDSISLSMDYYWKKLMDKFNIGPKDTEDSPIRTKVRRSKCPPVPNKARKKTEFLQIIGSILYGYTSPPRPRLCSRNDDPRYVLSQRRASLSIKKPPPLYQLHPSLASSLSPRPFNYLWYGLRLLWWRRFFTC